MATKKRTHTKAQKLYRHAPSKAWADGISSGGEVYPKALMPLSECKTLEADPTTIENYNPVGEHGEQRHTPRHNVGEEDMIDRLSPRSAKHYSRGWPSSAGIVVSICDVIRGS